MRLLVSVRNAEEAAAALGGGADIVDAKEPARGSLGAVEPSVLAAIAARVPDAAPLSVALGDCVTPEDVHSALGATTFPDRGAPVYLKLGFAGVESAHRVRALLETALESASAASRRVVVAVAYADHAAAGAPAAGSVVRAAVEAGAGGLLLDTWRKDGRGLLDHVGLEDLALLSRRARASGLFFAAAGSLHLGAVAKVAMLVDIVGVRGAACRGGREGRVDATLVAALRGALRGGRADLEVAEREAPAAPTRFRTA